MATEALSGRLPTKEETRSASEAAGAIRRALTDQGRLPLRINKDGADIRIELPPAVGRLVLDLLSLIGRGDMVTLVPYGTELTTQQAADILNVSRPHLTKLLEADEIPFHKVGSHRRIQATDLLAFKRKRDARRTKALKELQRLGQEYDAG